MKINNFQRHMLVTESCLLHWSPPAYGVPVRQLQPKQDPSAVGSKKRLYRAVGQKQSNSCLDVASNIFQEIYSTDNHFSKMSFEYHESQDVRGVYFFRNTS